MPGDAAVCGDDIYFVDEAGYGCSEWNDPSLTCATATHDGHLSTAGQTKLMQACPYACGMCTEYHAVRHTTPIDGFAAFSSLHLISRDGHAHKCTAASMDHLPGRR